MNLKQIMTQGVETINPDANLHTAAQKMRDLNVGFLPIYADGKVLGVVTDRDITVRATAGGLDPNNTPVSRIMTDDVVTCLEDESVEAAAQAMNARQIRRIIVLDHSDKIVGVVSLGDLAVDGLDDEEVGKVLQTISWPARPEGQAR